jgi:hypothetical protein
LTESASRLVCAPRTVSLDGPGFALVGTRLTSFLPQA